MGKRKADIRREIKDRLHSMERFGESKKAAKAAREADQGIYSHSTAVMYHRECQRFADYVITCSPQGRYTPLEAAKSYAAEYIAMENANPDKSAYTVKAERSALAKLFQCRGEELGEVKTRSRSAIKRSRNRTIVSEKTGKIIKNPKTRAGRFSEKKHPDLVVFARSTGMRRSEMSCVRGDQLYEDGSGGYIFRMEGHQCKGGRQRDIPVRGDVKRIVELARAAGHGKIFSKVPQSMDVHYYRSQYATALYKELAREEIPRQDRFYCRRDMAGTVYDRAAMEVTSQALGHSRTSVISEHYLRK